MPSRADRCAIPRCRRPPILTYLDRFPICEVHWENHGSLYHLLVKLSRVPDDFPGRVKQLRALLRRGSDEDIRGQGPEITGRTPLHIFRVYLDDRLAERLPISWDQPFHTDPSQE